MKRKIWGAVLLATLLMTSCARLEKPSATAPGTTVTQVPTEPSTEETTVPTAPEIPTVQAPDSLCSALESGGIALEELSRLGCSQLITVTAAGNTAQIALYVLEADQWSRQDALNCSGYVGSGGLTDVKREGDMCTPKGLYSVEQAFYIQQPPNTGLQTFPVTADTYWVDDPASVYYNKRIEGEENKDWNSAERMIEYTEAYRYGFVVGYNLASVPYAGSAIFFHVGARPTAGCIATDETFVLQYLALLDDSKSPYILIY